MKTTLLRAVKCLTVLFFIGILKPAKAQQFLPLEFFKESFEKMAEKAGSEKKPFLVFFSADGSQKSAQMDSIFQNKWVQTYVSKRYLAQRMQAFSLYAEPVARRYGITQFPCVALFAPNASLTHKVENVSNPKEFIATLTAYENATGSALSQTTNPDAAVNSSDPLLSLKLQEEAKIEAVYKISIEKHELQARTLAVQVGVFADYENLMKNVMILRENWHDNILITQYELSDKKIFRLLLGPLYSMEHAQSYKNSLKEKKGINAIIVNMETFAPISEAQASDYTLESQIELEKAEKEEKRKKNRRR